MEPNFIADALIFAAFVVFVLVAVALSIVDLRTFRLPDRLLLPAIAAIAVLFAAAGATIGDTQNLERALMIASVNTFIHLGLHLANGSALGFGDVKLAALIGLTTGWLGTNAWLVALAGSFLAAGCAVIMLMAKRLATATTEIAFGPWMLLAATAAIIGAR